MSEAPDPTQLRQALEKLSFMDAVNLAMALARRLHVSPETMVRAMIAVAAEAATAGGVTEEVTVTEEV